MYSSVEIQTQIAVSTNWDKEVYIDSPFKITKKDLEVVNSQILASYTSLIPPLSSLFCAIEVFEIVMDDWNHLSTWNITCALEVPFQL